VLLDVVVELRLDGAADRRLADRAAEGPERVEHRPHRERALALERAEDRVGELANALSDRLGSILSAAELTAAQFNVRYMLIEDGPMKLSALAEQRRCVKSNVIAGSAGQVKRSLRPPVSP
jgi:hypothetical protein